MASQNYEPFGIEWEREVTKLPKKILIAKLKELLIKQQRLKTEQWTPEVHLRHQQPLGIKSETSRQKSS